MMLMYANKKVEFHLFEQNFLNAHAGFLLCAYSSQKNFALGSVSV